MLTVEPWAKDRLATSAVMFGEVAALKHELQRTRARQARLFLEELGELEPSPGWFVTIGAGRPSSNEWKTSRRLSARVAPVDMEGTATHVGDDTVEL